MTEKQVLEFLFNNGIIDIFVEVGICDETATTRYQNRFDPEYSYETFGDCVWSEDVQICPQSLFNALIDLNLK